MLPNRPDHQPLDLHLHGLGGEWTNIHSEAPSSSRAARQRQRGR